MRDDLLDDFDPLEPPPGPQGGSADADDDLLRDDTPAEALPQDEEADPASFSDPKGIVRLWFEDGRLQRVRVSPVWFNKVAAKGLEGCFAVALLSARTRLPQPEPSPEAELDLSDVPPLTPATRAAFVEQWRALERCWDAVVKVEAPASPKLSPAVVFGRSKGVEVHLDRVGFPVSVLLDARWAREAHAGQIAKGVVAAAARAYSEFGGRPPAAAPQVGLAKQFAMMRSVYQAMMRKQVQG